MITAYLVGALATLVLFAIRTPDTEVRPAAVICAFWPVIVPLILLTVLFDAFGWNFDFDPVKVPFGFRKATNPNVNGFAITILFVEFKVYKAFTA